jgi:hypothetical protein
MSLICVSYGREIECSSACAFLPGVWAPAGFARAAAPTLPT